MNWRPIRLLALPFWVLVCFAIYVTPGPPMLPSHWFVLAVTSFAFGYEMATALRRWSRP